MTSRRRFVQSLAALSVGALPRPLPAATDPSRQALVIGNAAYRFSPLTAITAAVVGVILNLALFFCAHVLWPQGLAGGALAGFDGIAALLAAGAAVALFRFKVGVIPVIGACAVLGGLLSLLR